MSKQKRVVDETTGEVLDPVTSPDFYTLDAIRHADVWTPETIKQEYTRLRNIAEQRLRTMAKSEIGRASRTYRTNKDRFKPVSEMTLGQTKIMLHEVSRMISAKTGTLSGIKAARAQSIQTFREHGYEFVTEENYNEFGEFMREWKDSQYRGYGSTTAVDFFESAARARQNVSGEDFNRASVSSNKSGSIAEQFAQWRKQRAQEQAAGRKTNKEGVTAYDLLDSWEEFLE